MKPEIIYYRNLTNNSCYKLELNAGLPPSVIDDCLDAIGYKQVEFISEEEFLKAHDKLMELVVLDKTESFVIGTLTTKYLEILPSNL